IAKGDVAGGFKTASWGAGLATAGVVAIADLPVSFCGDVITLPVAYARSTKQPWATWWGEESLGNWREPLSPDRLAPRQTVDPQPADRQIPGETVPSETGTPK